MSDMSAIRAIIRDEFLQIIATGVVMLLIVGIATTVDEYMRYALGAAAASPTEFSDIDSAMGAASMALGTQEANLITIFNDLQGTSKDIGLEASRSVFCNFLGVGFALNNCSPLNAFRGSITAASFATTTALADVYAQKGLLSLAANTAFQFIIPLGLFFRCFKTSRQAGGALIAIGFGFHTAYPLSIVAFDKLLHGDAAAPNFATPTLTPGVPECDPEEIDADAAYSTVRDYANSLSDFDRAENLAYIVLVRSLFASILTLIVTLGFVRTFAHMIGSEIDVSSLARIS
jgi:hypothetical protein